MQEIMAFYLLSVDFGNTAHCDDDFFSFFESLRRYPTCEGEDWIFKHRVNGRFVTSSKASYNKNSKLSKTIELTEGSDERLG